MRTLDDAWAYLSAGANWRGEEGLLHLLGQQLLLTAAALLIAMAIALPLASWAGHTGRGGFWAVNLSGVGRAVPTFALLGIFVAADPWSWTGGVFPGTAQVGPLGRAGAATVVALALFALPPIITNTYVALREVPEAVVDAARGLGLSGWQRFRQVEIPLALPVILTGLRLALIQVWATATIAALVAGPGLGRVITDGFAQTRYGQAVAGAVVVAVVAVVLEVLATLAQRGLSVGPSKLSGTS